MRIQNLSYVLLAWLFMGATCERSVDLKIEEPDARIVLSSAFTLGEKVKVEVSKTQSLFNYSAPEYLTDATVSLYQGDQLIEKLLLIEPSLPLERIRPYFTTVNFEPLPAITYTIKAVVEGFTDVFAHSFIPESVPITRFEVSGLKEKPGSEVYRTLYEYEILFDFNDPEEEENYYHLNIFQELLQFDVNTTGDTVIIDKTWVRANIDIDAPDVVSDAMIGGLLLKNNPFENGLSFNLAVEITPEFQMLGKAFVELRTVSREYYLFYSTFSLRQNQNDGPFTDPVTVFNNIENGQGYFAGYNTIQDSVTIGL